MPIIKAKDITWYPTPQYGECQTFILDHYEMKTKRLLQIFLFFKENKNRIMLTIHDKERVLIKRGLKAEIDSYDGEHMELDLENPMNRKYFISMKQNIHLEMESGINCKNYPSGDFSSYRDCDEDFVYNEMKIKHNLMPFWAAQNLDEVTKLT